MEDKYLRQALVPLGVQDKDWGRRMIYTFMSASLYIPEPLSRVGLGAAWVVRAGDLDLLLLFLRVGTCYALSSPTVNQQGAHKMHYASFCNGKDDSCQNRCSMTTSYNLGLNADAPKAHLTREPEQ